MIVDVLTVQITAYRTLRGLGLYIIVIFNSLSDISPARSIPFASLIQVLAGWMIKDFFQNRNSVRRREAVSVAKKTSTCLPFPRILQRDRKGEQREEQKYLKHIYKSSSGGITVATNHQLFPPREGIT